MKTIILSHQKNIRDLGGLPSQNDQHIKYGRLFRGGALHRVNEDDINILKDLKITDIVDFRGEEEFVLQPDVRIDGVRYHSLPAIEERVKKEDIHNDDGNLLWFVGKGKSGYEHMKQQYRNLINDKKSQDAYRQFFKILSQENVSTYYHCSQGKDRAGLASYLIETILGVEEEEKIKDYLYSNNAMEAKINTIIEQIKNKNFYDETYHQSLLDVFAARVEYLQCAIEEMDKNYGGVLKYIEYILNVDIDKFRQMYLE